MAGDGPAPIRTAGSRSCRPATERRTPPATQTIPRTGGPHRNTDRILSRVASRAGPVDQSAVQGGAMAVGCLRPQPAQLLVVRLPRPRQLDHPLVERAL